MTSLVQSVTTALGIGTIILDVFVVLGFLSLFFFSKTLSMNPLFRWIGKYSLVLAFLVSLGAILASLFYSQIAGFAPCELCWLQRIFIYPQAFLFGLALYKKRKRNDVEFVWSASLLLSVVGAAIAVFHYYGQSYNTGILAYCGATGVSCSQLYFTLFGFITIPFMSLTLFLALILLVLIKRKV
jgi:disulfide bond formation protein DsbB